ncbi:hypothetical protein EDD37DRAFT_373736 [Exophiala viscosa]|uniref:Uncharacterized protein n=1 Tax=Exophiala viscosa TaxID=2486360 RepID=A0AAN6DRL7_9EURO|nr:hypothetical protein EDD36DRAFT_60387 [Exophiala viscosa]KAI1625023.1 hypothetical protein EDD37DRAFT_373736 [Exophiala viscosa]
MSRSDAPDALFLNPPHSHDPSNVSHVAALPISMLSQLPQPIQEKLWDLQESTSIVYASYIRLQTLLDERFDRLVEMPFGKGSADSYSEGAFFNYVNHLAAERQYLLEDAHPDWKHKATRSGLRQYGDLMVTFRGKEMTVNEWFSQLQTAETFWIQAAKEMEVPDFESTILEFQSQTTTPISESSDDADSNFGGDAVPTGRKAVDSERLGFGVSKALEDF